ncbi:hypothetical protein [Piscirickettsia litoralis]|uniref:Uncharacterized protein n=1 Tax=Piscirickettsia litoralis TaxID=1891921 RepID=A0ABX2ZZ75_9GAMM|nr:hypothetical protein [Piscirickettsia litoralis]ODN41505.1 hypothetical protein BGC07_15465 [Piscirickettsia litoralis]
MKNTALEKKVREMTDKVDGWDDRVEVFVETILSICEHYAEYFKLDPVTVFEALEKNRDYSYPNYYQEGNFPKLDESVLVFQDEEETRAKFEPEKGFICPVCDWKSYGLFKTLGKGLRFTIAKDWLERPFVDECFMPVALASNIDTEKKVSNG